MISLIIDLVPKFAHWSDWSACSTTCDSGERTRTRTCTDACSYLDASDPTMSLSDQKRCTVKKCGKFKLSRNKMKKIIIMGSEFL